MGMVKAKALGNYGVPAKPWLMQPIVELDKDGTPNRKESVFPAEENPSRRGVMPLEQRNRFVIAEGELYMVEESLTKVQKVKDREIKPLFEKVEDGKGIISSKKTDDRSSHESS